jgi:hypothetical protein
LETWSGAWIAFWLAIPMQRHLEFLEAGVLCEVWVPIWSFQDPFRFRPARALVARLALLCCTTREFFSFIICAWHRTWAALWLFSSEKQHLNLEVRRFGMYAWIPLWVFDDTLVPDPIHAFPTGFTRTGSAAGLESALSFTNMER